MKTVLPVFLAIALVLPSQSHADDKSAPHKLAMFRHVSPQVCDPPKTSDSAPPPQSPVIPNRIADCLPGKMLDVSSALKAAEIKLTGDDFAWYNPEGGILLIRASGEDLAKVQTNFIGDSSFDPYAPTAVVDCAISIGTDADGKNPKTDQLRWRVSAMSSMRATSSATAGAKGIAYSLEFEAGLSPDVGVCDFIMDLKVTTQGSDYHLTTGLALDTGKTETLILGTTPEGKDVCFHVTVNVSTPHRPPVSVPNDGPRDVALLKQIEKSLSKTK